MILQKITGTWADKNFPQSTPSSMVTHLKREVEELEQAVASEAGVPEEAADCLLLLCHLAHRLGFDLEVTAWDKLAHNIERPWGEPDAEGVVEHIR